MRVPMRFRDRAQAYKNECDRTVISAAIRGSVYREIPLSELTATQRHVSDERVRQYVDGAHGKHTPIVLEHGGKLYIHNGHHRAVAGIERGDKTLRARVATLDGPRKFADGRKAGTLLLIDPHAMAASYAPREEACVEIVEGGIAVLTIEGPLESKPGNTWMYFDDYESIMARFHDALADNEVRGVLLKIDSPGGMAAGLNATVDAMRKLKKQFGKPVCAYADEKCCSAAYALACVADDIYLPPAAEIGSIGVTSTLVDATKANKMAGLKVAVVTSGARKADGNPDVELTDETVAHLQKRVDHLADLYYRLVEKARGLSVETIKALEADTFDGQDAVDAGLADAVWSLDRTLSTMRAELDQNPGLDRKAEGMTENDRSPEINPMTKKLTAKHKRVAVAKLEKALARAKAELAASEKTPPAKTEEEEEEGEGEGGTRHTKRVKRTEEIEEEEIGSTEGSESEPPEEAEEEEDAAGSEEEADAAGSEEEADDDAEEEEATQKAATQLLALAQSATGKCGQRAVGALAAMIAEGQLAAKRVRKISAERASEKKTLSIDSALANRRITRHEAKDLRSKSSRFVKDFLSMRKHPLVAIDDEQLRTPSHKSGAELPSAVLAQIDEACLSVPDAQREDVRKKMIAAQRERAVNANGGGRF